MINVVIIIQYVILSVQHTQRTATTQVFNQKLLGAES